MATVRQQALKIADAFTGGPAVGGPDHPYLIAGPDLLAADEWGLVALFIPHAAEKRQSRLFEGRLILSKLALPSHTRFVSLANDDPVTAPSFDRLLDEGDAREMARGLRDLPQRRERTPVPVQVQVRERFARVNFQASRDDVRFDVPPPYRFPTRSRSVRWSGGRIESDLRSTGRRQLNARVRSLLAISATTEFALDDGAVYTQVERLPVHSLLVDPDLLGEQRGDPFKLQRALAFGGWTVPGLATERDFWSQELGARWEEEG